MDGCGDVMDSFERLRVYHTLTDNFQRWLQAIDSLVSECLVDMLVSCVAG